MARRTGNVLVAALLGVALSASTASMAPLTVQAAGGCQFVLGFEALHSLIPGTAGACLDNQTFAANGDALQHTSNGLMVWRKADNFTAFTNGDQTWVNGPCGVQQRANVQRFQWESGRQGCALASTAASTASGGSNVSGGLVRGDGYSFVLPAQWSAVGGSASSWHGLPVGAGYSASISLFVHEGAWDPTSADLHLPPGMQLSSNAVFNGRTTSGESSFQMQIPVSGAVGEEIYMAVQGPSRWIEVDGQINGGDASAIFQVNSILASVTAA